MKPSRKRSAKSRGKPFCTPKQFERLKQIKINEKARLAAEQEHERADATQLQLWAGQESEGICTASKRASFPPPPDSGTTACQA